MADWATYINLSHISGLSKMQSASRHVGYILREDECVYSNLEDNESIETEKAEYQKLFADEKRIDSRLLSRLVITLPNDSGLKDYIALENAMKQEFAKHGDVQFTFAVHKGLNGKSKKQNKHIHVVYSERDKTTRKKIRSLKSKDEFLNAVKKTVDEHFRKQYKQRSTTNVVATRLHRIKYEQFLSKKHDARLAQDAQFRSWTKEMCKHHQVKDVFALRAKLLNEPTEQRIAKEKQKEAPKNLDKGIQVARQQLAQNNLKNTAILGTVRDSNATHKHIIDIFKGKEYKKQNLTLKLPLQKLQQVAFQVKQQIQLAKATSKTISVFKTPGF